jgi:hypothetical protein
MRGGLDMSDYTQGKFADARIPLDGNSYTECTFTRCRLVYRGGAPPSITDCYFDACRLEMVGAAANTVILLQAMASPSSGMQQLIRDTFRSLTFN